MPSATLLMAAVLACTSPRVVDGDTLHCGGERVRLAGIDAPELPGHCRRGRRCVRGDAAAAAQHLRRLTQGQHVTCEWNRRDRYGRPITRCTAAGADLSCAMLASGHAVARYSKLECNR